MPTVHTQTNTTRNVFQRLVDSSPFQWGIILLILVASAIAGIDTYPNLSQTYHQELRLIESIILWVFVGEIVCKMIAQGWRVWRYFYEPWNVFDFLIVVVCFLPFAGPFATVLRLARVVRVLRLVTVLPSLQMVVTTLLKSLPAMGYIVILMCIHFYVYAVLGTYYLRPKDPQNFGTLHDSMLSLFRVLTLENWSVLMRNQADTNGQVPVGILFYFVSFIIVSTFLLLNLVIGVIVHSMMDARNEAEVKRLKELQPDSLTAQLLTMEQELADMQQRLRVLRKTRLASEPDQESET